MLWRRDEQNEIEHKQVDDEWYFHLLTSPFRTSKRLLLNE